MRLDSQSSDYLSFLAVEGKRASATHTPTWPSGLISIEPAPFIFISFDAQMCKIIIFSLLLLLLLLLLLFVYDGNILILIFDI